MKNLINKLINNNITISCCESFTGGFFSNLITNQYGSSKVFKGSIIAYSDYSKIKIVNVDQSILKKYGAVSEEAATEMCKKSRILFNTDISVSFTGNAPNKDNLINEAYICIFFEDIYYNYKLSIKTRNRSKFKKYMSAFTIKKILSFID